MRSSQAVLRLCGGLASALTAFLALLSFLFDVLGWLADGHFLYAMHYFAVCLVLGAVGAAGVLAEIRPHPVVTENAPYLGRLGGRSTVYMLLGMYILGQPRGKDESAFRTGLDRVVGLYIMGVAMAGWVFAQQMRNLPPALSEPALREMHAPAASSTNLEPMPPAPTLPA
eukprot:TRINITY_DN34464_c0_g1_i1.p1 TRINITY_DN34464_c0_g1~~TRINITY_DN34464_c0_g1_i1.p1  ORF type:complete len:170 (+),score=24.74 TRINITY_DN34464_c0_g1_i1:132-641(+)